MKFYPGETEICKKFVESITTLDITVSTAQLQGLFVMNKDAPEDAVKMVTSLRNSNRIF